MYYISRGAFAILSKILSPVRESALVNPVKSKYRNKGIGSLLFKNIESYFVDKRIRRCFLEVNENNNLAINFYKKIGFVYIKKIKNYYKVNNSYQDGLLLQKTYI